jgi:transposase
VQRAVNQSGIKEVVADKGYHSNEVIRTLAEWKLRSYVAEPERGARKWKGKAAEQAAVYANRRRISGTRGKRLQAGRGERVERNFAHQFDTGGMDRLYVRGLNNVHKRLLIQAAACNLALLMRSLYGAGKPRAAHDRWGQLTFAILRLYSALMRSESEFAFLDARASRLDRPAVFSSRDSSPVKIEVLETGC